MKYIILSILTLLFVGCSKQSEVIRYYQVHSSSNEITAYYKIESNIEDNRRTDRVVRYDSKGVEEESYLEYYLFDKSELRQVANFEEPIRNLKIYSVGEGCFNSEGSAEPLEICFIEEQKYQNKIKSYLFTEKSLRTDGVQKEILFDKDFMLLTDEYTGGLLRYYKIEYTDKKPSIFQRSK